LQDHRYDMSQQEMHPLLEEIRQLLDSYGETYMVGETFNANAEKAASYISDLELHAGFQFDLLNAKFSAPAYRKAINDWLIALGNKWPNFVLNNHDTTRSSTRYHASKGDALLKVAAAALLTVKGTPFLYYGEEIGMRNIALRRSQILDPVSKRYWPFITTRDGCRSPMQWDDNAFSGFSTQRPWLPVHPNYSDRNVKKQLQEPGSLLNFYKQLLNLRRQHNALNKGSFEMIGEDNKQVLAYLRKYAEETILVCLNMSNKATHYLLPEPLIGNSWSVILAQFTKKAQLNIGIELVLQPYETMILRQN